MKLICAWETKEWCSCHDAAGTRRNCPHLHHYLHWDDQAELQRAINETIQAWRTIKEAVNARSRATAFRR